MWQDQAALSGLISRLFFFKSCLSYVLKYMNIILYDWLMQIKQIDMSLCGLRIKHLQLENDRPCCE